MLMMANALLPTSFTAKYQHHLEFGEKLLKSSVSLAKLHPLTETTAKTADLVLSFFKSFDYMGKGVKSVRFLSSSGNIEKTGKNDKSLIIMNLASVILFPFAVISLMEM